MRYRVSHNTGTLLRAARGMGDDEDFNPYAPAEWGDGYFDYWDTAAGIYYDQYGNQWDVGGWWDAPPADQDFTADGYDAAGNVVVRLTTDIRGVPSGSVNLHELNNSLDWWNVNNGAPIVLPAITYDAGYILSVPSTTLASDPNAPAVLRSASTWDKIKAALAKVAKNVSMSAGAGSGAAAGGRPQSVQASASGQCPAGYAKNAAGQCQLVSQKPAADSLSSFLSNPLYLLLGVIALAVIIKK